MPTPAPQPESLRREELLELWKSLPIGEQKRLLELFAQGIGVPKPVFKK